MSEESLVITFYLDKYHVFDNYSACAIVWNNQKWPTVEHAYQASKFDNKKIIEEIREASSPHEAKSIAHAYCALGKDKTGWRESKVEVMRTLIRYKGEQHPHVKETLLLTKGVHLVEDSPFDTFWGCGPDRTGENWVGKIWMEYRDELLAKST